MAVRVLQVGAPVQAGVGHIEASASGIRCTKRQLVPAEEKQAIGLDLATARTTSYHYGRLNENDGAALEPSLEGDEQPQAHSHTSLFEHGRAFGQPTV